MKFRKTVALMLLLALVFSMSAASASSRSRAVVAVALKQLGKPYALNSSAPDSFNCVSLVAYCYNRVNSGTISKSGIRGRCTRITSTRKLSPGDVLCFKSPNNSKGTPDYHFGLYTGRGCFIHASSSAERVIMSKLKDYEGRFLGALRLF